jgi:predicted TIM-barrel fold metal-dependent hydrolase
MTDRIIFSTDYPHWDFDAPGQALPRALAPDVRAAILGENAVRLYGLRVGALR